MVATFRLLISFWTKRSKQHWCKKSVNSNGDYVLYNDCWHGFWVRSWWPRVLWQPVTLRLVNRGRAVRRGGPVEQVCNRKETTWYGNHAVRFDSQSSQNRESSQGYAADQMHHVVSDDTACKGEQALAHPGSRRKIWDKKKSPLWVHVSPFFSQIYNKLCAPFQNKMSEIYFYKKCVSFRLLKFVHYVWLCSWLGLFDHILRVSWSVSELFNQPTSIKT